MTDTASNSCKSAEQWLDEIESEIANVSPEVDTNFDLANDINEGNQQTKSRKIHHRMMQLYLTIASEDLKAANKVAHSDSLPYYTIVDSHNNNLNNINQAFLKRLDEKEIAQLKKLMLSRELSLEQSSTVRSTANATHVDAERPEASTTNNHSNAKQHEQMLVICSPINNKTNKLIDSLINQLEQQYTNTSQSQDHSIKPNVSTSPNSELLSENTSKLFSINSTFDFNSESIQALSSVDSFEFDEMNAKTKKLKSRMIQLKKKYEILKQKRLFEQDRKKKLFAAYVTSTSSNKVAKKQTKSKRKSARKFRKNTGDFQTRLNKYGMYNNVKSMRNHKNVNGHVEIVERRSASMKINPQTLTDGMVKTKQTRKRIHSSYRGRKTQRKQKTKKVRRMPWRG